MDQSKDLTFVQAGFGTVGCGVINLLASQSDLIAKRLNGLKINCLHLGARRDNPDAVKHNIPRLAEVHAVLNTEADVFVELMGGTDLAYDLVVQAINQGRSVVTANKALIAKKGNELFLLAKAKGVQIRFEAAVAGGIPIIKAIREGLAANNIYQVLGIINGTSNFILSQMTTQGLSFDDALQMAQALGYAEADPTFDIQGIDAAHKLTILAAIAFDVPFDFESVYCEGITQLDPQDFHFASEMGYVIKHLGIAEKTALGLSLRVHPTLVPKDAVLSKVSGAMNAVMVCGDAVPEALFYGPGAGAYPTASAVIADLIDIARGHPDPYGLPQASLPIASMDDISNPFYVRLLLKEAPGVLSKVLAIFSQKNISIDSIHQPEAHLLSGKVPLILLTESIRESLLKEVFEALSALPEILEAPVRIRMSHI